jgi:hypothetical protein
MAIHVSEDKGMPDKDTMQKIAQQAYKPEPEKTINNYNLIYKTNTLKFYRKGTTIVIGVRGTKLEDNNDLIADGLIAVGQLRTSDRYRHDREAIHYIQHKYPRSMYHYYGAGHSLGGALIDLFLDDGVILEGLSYNPAIEPYNLTRHLKNHRIYIEGDPLYLLYKNLLQQKPEVRPGRSKEFWEYITGFAGTLYDMYMSHQLKRFEGGAFPFWNKEKHYPDNYPTSVIRVLDALSLTKGQNLQIIGSAGLRSIQFSGDYDAYEVTSLSPAKLAVAMAITVKSLETIPNTYIGDIKCGEIKEWKVLKEPYNLEASRNTLKELIKLNAPGALEAGETMVRNPTQKEIFTYRELFKFHVIRWKPEDILKGYVTILGRKITLEEAIKTGGKTKIDAVSLVNDGRYVEFSVVYEHPDAAKRVQYIKELKEGVLEFSLYGRLFKSARRIFSIARYENDSKTAMKLLPLFNGDMGRLYSVISDINMILYLIENHIGKTEFMGREIQGFKSRLANVWNVPEFIRKEPRFDRALDNASKEPKEAMTVLMSLSESFQKILDSETKKAMESVGLYPIPSKYLP